MTQIEQEMIDHLKDFPKRRKELLEFQKKTLKNDKSILEDVSAIKRQIATGLTHPQPSAKTIAMIGEVKDEVKEVRSISEIWTVENTKKMERIERVLFGDPFDIEDKGMQGMLKDIHSKAVGKDGFWNQLFFIGKVAGTWTAIALVVTGMYHLLKK